MDMVFGGKMRWNKSKREPGYQSVSDKTKKGYDLQQFAKFPI